MAQNNTNEINGEEFIKIVRTEKFDESVFPVGFQYELNNELFRVVSNEDDQTESARLLRDSQGKEHVKTVKTIIKDLQDQSAKVIKDPSKEKEDQKKSKTKKKNKKK